MKICSLVLVPLLAGVVELGSGFSSKSARPSKQLTFVRANTLSMSVSSADDAPDGGAKQDPSESKSSSTSSSGPSPPEVYGRFEYDLNNLAPSETRRDRIQSEEETKSRFVHGDDVVELRKKIDELRGDLVDARNNGDVTRIRELKTRITEAGRRDAELIYRIANERMKKAEEEGLEDRVEKFRKEAVDARSVLPQFNIEGLWVGKYGDHGYEMINVTYAGDSIIAYKVTGDKNVPKGEVTFTVDLSPDAAIKAGLEPIELSDGASDQWGTKHLARFPGKGQVAAEGFQNSQWMEGQLIMVGEYFSFAWVPLGHQIFFGRPSAELTLKMLKASEISELGGGRGGMKDVAQMRASAMRCWEETEMLEDDLETEGSSSGSGIFLDEEDAFQ
eukprot:CAMPEP_0183307318 /NCGR_PEP_ID=MMETSP0160_2-20130417/17260_1 /TAXON_ID=2839 ORGANISM="Odontella Sinensis, Strain Grunow 1884" /NCGR_SAMPLE_ID=MMETSP0160_2 /ASSEMBLY_ACC=CAM_ASM_000250 /LENGTH=388 /DNA_ID=CAMNT_0025470879 /DNA_START=73 /DNA_END=1239 /DNA_ORIENTATION=+